MEISPMFFTIQGISLLAAPPSLDLKQEDPYFKEMVNHRIEFLNTDHFNIHFFNSMTNLKIIIVTSTAVTEVKSIFSDIYKAYADFVIKDPGFTVSTFCQLPSPFPTRGYFGGDLYQLSTNLDHTTDQEPILRQKSNRHNPRKG